MIVHLFLLHSGDTETRNLGTTDGTKGQIFERVCMVTVSNACLGGLTPTYPYTYQADLEKIERDLAESKKVSVLAGRGRMH